MDNWERWLWNSLAALGCIALLVFLGTTAQLYWRGGGFADFWTPATAVFTFFGALLTAGAAFATVAAVVSYLSVNGKLREAKSSLKKFRQLDEQRKQLKQDIAAMDEYRVIAQDLAQHDLTATDNSRSIAAAEKILQSPHADFETRLKAHAIVREQEIDRLFEQAETQDSEEAWQEVIAARADNLSAWKLLFQAALPTTEQTDKNNYATALFNYGTAFLFYGIFLKENQNAEAAIRQLQLAGKQYAQALKINEDIHQAATNWGNVLDDEATALAVAGNLPQAQELWKQAREKYKQSLTIKKDNDLVVYNWLWSLRREAKHLSPEEQLNLWQTAHTQATGLQKLSPAHQNSAVIQNLLAAINQEIQTLTPEQNT